MKTTFTYPLPTENYVAGISTTRVGTYNYDGPDEIVFEIGDEGQIIDIDPDYEIFDPVRHRIVVKPKENANDVPVAYFFQDRFCKDTPDKNVQDGFVHNYTYNDEPQSNGEVYKAKVNLRLSDAYELVWDYEKSNGAGIASGNWSFVQKTREETNIWKQRGLMRAASVGIYTNHQSLSNATHVGVASYIAECKTFADANPAMKEWKVLNTPKVGTEPKLAEDARKEIIALTAQLNLPLLDEDI
tara:strand:- start:175 stop:903 length:729 start_codon:yes stop_codon:yes gene_type:complete